MNNSQKNIEYIRTTCPLRGRAKSPRPRRQVKKEARLYEARDTGHETRIIPYFQLHPIFTNKPNFRKSVNDASSVFTKDYKFHPSWRQEKTNPIFTLDVSLACFSVRGKPNSNPNKPNFFIGP